jgi:hypothetical protein
MKMANDHFLLLLIEELVTATKEQAQSMGRRPINRPNIHCSGKPSFRPDYRVSVGKTVVFHSWEFVTAI